MIPNNLNQMYNTSYQNKNHQAENEEYNTQSSNVNESGIIVHEDKEQFKLSDPLKKISRYWLISPIK